MRRIPPLLKLIDEFYVKDENLLSSYSDDIFLIELFEHLRYRLFKLYTLAGPRHLSSFELDYIGLDFGPLSDYGRAFVKKVGLETKKHKNLLCFLEKRKFDVMRLPFEFLIELYHWYYTIEQRLFINELEAIFRAETCRRRAILNMHDYVIKGFDERNSPVYGCESDEYVRPYRWFTFFGPPKLKFKKDRHVLVDKGFCPYYYYVQWMFNLADREGAIVDEFFQKSNFVHSGISLEVSSEMLFKLLSIDAEILCLFSFIEKMRGWLPRSRRFLASRRFLIDWSASSSFAAFRLLRKYRVYCKISELIEDLEIEKLFTFGFGGLKGREATLTPFSTDQEFLDYPLSRACSSWVFAWTSSTFRGRGSWCRRSHFWFYKQYFVLLGPTKYANSFFYSSQFLLKTGFVFLGLYKVKPFSRYYLKKFKPDRFRSVFAIFSKYTFTGVAAFSRILAAAVSVIKALHVRGFRRRRWASLILRCKTFKTFCWLFTFVLDSYVRGLTKFGFRGPAAKPVLYFKNKLQRCFIRLVDRRALCFRSGNRLFFRYFIRRGSQKRKCLLVKKHLNEVMSVLDGPSEPL